MANLFTNDGRFSASDKMNIFAQALHSNDFDSRRKQKCVDLGKQIVNNVSDEKIINQVAELASRYIQYLSPVNDPAIGQLVQAIAIGNAQVVIDFLNKNRMSWTTGFRLSQISDIFLTMMSNYPFNFFNRSMIFDTFLRLFGGYFLLGANLEIDETGNITVKNFENIGTMYYHNDKYPDNVQVYSHGSTHCLHDFAFSKLGDNLKYDKFTPSEILKAIESPFPVSLRLQCKLSECAQNKINVVKEAEEAKAAGVKKQIEASEAANAAAQKEREDKVEKARMEFEASEKDGYAGQSVIGADTISVKGGRRTRSKRSGHKRSGHKRSGHKRSGHKRSGHKRSGHKRSGHKRSSKRSGHKSRRR